MQRKKLYLMIMPLALSVLLIFNGCSKDNPVNPGSGNTTTSVNGKLITGDGSPIPSATVVIGGSSTSSGADGSFTISGVTTPYDVNIISGTYGVRYEGLTSPNPQLLTIGPAAVENTATISITIPAMTANQTCRIFFTDGADIQRSTSFTFPTTSANLTVNWAGSSNLTGKLIALIHTSNAGVITTYDKYGEKSDLTLSNGTTTSFTFTPAILNVDPGEETVSGSINAPSGMTTIAASLYLKFANGSAFANSTFLGSANGNTYSFKVPAGLTTTPKIFINGGASGVIGSTGKRIEVVMGSSGTVITLDNNGTISSPPDNATLVDTSTVFNFAPGGGTGVNFISFSSGGKFFRIFTTASNVKIPNMSAQGLTIGSNANYLWQVAKYNTFAGMDEIVSNPLYYNSAYNSQHFSAVRSFTTKP